MEDREKTGADNHIKHSPITSPEEMDKAVQEVEKNEQRVNPKFCVNSIWGANRAKFIQGGSRGIRLLPC